MLAGSIVYPWSEAEAVLRRYAEFAATMPDELGITVGMTTGPNGQLSLLLLPLWNGDKHRGERIISDLQAIGTPQFAQVGPMAYGDMLAPYDAAVDAADGWHYEMRTRSLPALTRDAIDVITRAVAGRTSPYSMVNWHHFHGAATRIPAEQIVSACARNISCWRSSPVGCPTGVTAQRTGNGRRTCGKVSPHLRYQAATPTSWGHMIANRPGMPTAATALG
jgi:hypothetical protein